VIAFDVILNFIVVIGGCREDELLELGPEFLCLGGFLIDLSGRQRVGRQDILAFTLNAGAVSVILAIDVDAVLQPPNPETSDLCDRPSMAGIATCATNRYNTRFQP
jgi:hypothetical protein